MHSSLDHAFFFNTLISVDFLVFIGFYCLLDSGSSEVIESVIEQQEPEQEVIYYYQGKHPLCTMLILNF